MEPVATIIFEDSAVWVGDMPEKIGRYEIVEPVGKGGMATVYRAIDPNFDREVAVKVLPQAMLHDDTFRTRFEREARTVARLEHPAIVPVYDFGEENGQPYLVMRYMQGGSLANRLTDGPLPIAGAAEIVNQLAPALDEAHAQGIIHRDLKPGNILFDQHGQAYIADFGIAKLSQESMALTGSATIGTPAYMSPEQARGDLNIDGRSDIYSLGAILFEMLTGRLPYDAETPMGIAVRHITEPVPRIRDVRPDLPEDCNMLILQAMAKDKELRFRSAIEMSEALDAISRGDAIPTMVAERVAAAVPAAATAEMSGAPDYATARIAVPLEEKVRAQHGEAVPVAATRDANLPEPDPRLSTGEIRKRNNIRAIVIAVAVVIALSLLRQFRLEVLSMAWPGYILIPGALLTYIGTREKKDGARQVLTITGSIIAMIGGLLLYQAIFKHYESWAYAWSLITPGGIGLGFVLAGRVGKSPREEKIGVTLVRIALAIFLIGWVFFEVLIQITEKPLAAVMWLPALVIFGAVFFARKMQIDEMVTIHGKKP